MPDRRRLLILGASGLLGRHLHRLVGAERAIATYHSQPLSGGVPFDAARMRLRDTLLRGAHGIGAAFVLYGVTRVDDCARDPRGSALVNVESVRNAVDDLLAAGVKVVFASSDAVFDGTRGMLREEDVPAPVLTYGRQKLEVERHLESKNAPWVVARLSKLVSGLPEPRNLLNEWVDRIERNEPVRCATDLVFSPADVRDAAYALLRLAQEPFTGVYNVCGSRAMSWLDLMRILLGELRAHRAVEARPVECRMRDLPLAEPRPLDISLDPSKLYTALGRGFRQMEAVCAELAASRWGTRQRGEAA